MHGRNGRFRIGDACRFCVRADGAGMCRTLRRRGDGNFAKKPCKARGIVVYYNKVKE